MKQKTKISIFLYIPHSESTATCLFLTKTIFFLQICLGAERLLKHLHATNVPIALATSSSQEIAEIKMANHSAVFDLFHHKVMGSTDPDVKVGKPAPDIFLVAAQRFPDKPNPANVRPNALKATTNGHNIQTVSFIHSALYLRMHRMVFVQLV